ncbi:uncharacterized protein LDX57_010341 [Aspergillus melleus]|uniref:uncharacterized protein n=1 Tax=Aspergillus melleus TaxID=138277 RepID=UPI001E8D8453|nr:uncharacterized protein LDX57_010341 [Aspergillus melleus]KAH8432714.1 hypothetical protein LDX57_010341 [Aspergillus melleus]
MNRVVLIVVILALMVNLIHASPVATAEPHDIRSVLDGFNKIGTGVTELDKAVKVYNNKTDIASIRTLAYNVEWLIMRTFDDVSKNKDFNDKDSKTLTAAHLKFKQGLETMLGDLIKIKDLIKKTNKSDFMFNNFESLHSRCFPLSDALENKATDPESKSIGAITEQLDRSFENALKQIN